MKTAFAWAIALSLISCCSAQFIYDDFEDGNADGWVVTEGVWAIESPGVWGSNYCYGSNSLTSETYHQYALGHRFVLEVKFWINSEPYGNFDIEFDYLDSNNYYMVDLADPDSDDPNARLYKYVNGVETILDEAPNIISAGAWEGMWIERSFEYWDRIDVYLLAHPIEPILSSTDSSLNADTAVRFRFYGGGKIDNFEFRLPDTVAEIPSVDLPAEFYLHTAYPNPFNPTTTIPFELKYPGEISLIVYDVLGREVSRLHQGWLQAGNYTTTFDGSRVPSGVYFVRLNAGDFRQTRKMVLMK